jgi:hypothetical protein
MEWKTSRRKISFLADLVNGDCAEGTDGDDEMELEKDDRVVMPKLDSIKSKLPKQKRKFVTFA